MDLREKREQKVFSPRARTSASLFRWPEALAPGGHSAWQGSLLAPPAPPHGVVKAVGLSTTMKFAGRGVFSSASNLMPIFTTSSVQSGPCLALDYHRIITKLSFTYS